VIFVIAGILLVCLHGAIRAGMRIWGKKESQPV
jgi:hypothetical protein